MDTTLNDNKLSSNEIKLAAQLLGRLQPGFLPFDIFIQVARLTVLSIVEVVPLCRNGQGDTEVLLLPRGADDQLWPDMLHVPGTVIRPDDGVKPLPKAFSRVMDEMQQVRMRQPKFVTNIFRKTKRGNEYVHIYWAEVLSNPTIGSFYKVDDLPSNIVEDQPSLISQAVSSYEAER